VSRNHIMEYKVASHNSTNYKDTATCKNSAIIWAKLWMTGHVNI